MQIIAHADKLTGRVQYLGFLPRSFEDERVLTEMAETILQGDALFEVSGPCSEVSFRFHSNLEEEDDE